MYIYICICGSSYLSIPFELTSPIPFACVYYIHIHKYMHNCKQHKNMHIYIYIYINRMYAYVCRYMCMYILNDFMHAQNTPIRHNIYIFTRIYVCCQRMCLVTCMCELALEGNSSGNRGSIRTHMSYIP